MSEIILKNVSEIENQHVCNHSEYEYFIKKIISRDDNANCLFSIYEIPPLKSAYPYHSHTSNEEVFYIISGKGVLRKPDSEKNVRVGDVIFCPANEKGAHKLTNVSSTENLVYLDFDTVHDLDICFYPDSNKIGVWGKGINKTFKEDSNVGYYFDE